MRMQMVKPVALLSAALGVNLCGCSTVPPNDHVRPDPVAHKIVLVERLLEVSNDGILREEANQVRSFLEADIKSISGSEMAELLEPMNAAVRKTAIQSLANDFSSDELQRLIEVYTDPIVRKYWATWPFYQIKLRDWRVEFLDEHSDIHKRIWKLKFPDIEPPEFLFNKQKPNKPTGGDAQ